MEFFTSEFIEMIGGAAAPLSPFKDKKYYKEQYCLVVLEQMASVAKKKTYDNGKEILFFSDAYNNRFMEKIKELTYDIRDFSLVECLEKRYKSLLLGTMFKGEEMLLKQDKETIIELADYKIRSALYFLAIVIYFIVAITFEINIYRYKTVSDFIRFSISVGIILLFVTAICLSGRKNVFTHVSWIADIMRKITEIN